MGKKSWGLEGWNFAAGAWCVSWGLEVFKNMRTKNWGLEVWILQPKRVPGAGAGGF